MFTTLKNKIKEETGNDVCVQSRYLSQRHSLTNSSIGSNGGLSAASHFTISSTLDELNATIELKNLEIATLNQRLGEIDGKYQSLLSDYEHAMADKDRLEKSNEILDEALKVAQVQKELIYNEQDKIQNLQMQEISKLKSLLHFREQEAVDRLSTIKQKENQLEFLQSENARLHELEANFEDVQDELEKFRHAAQLEKNSLASNLAALEEQNRHLASKLQIFEEARINFAVNQSKDEKVQLLLRERRALEQRLEETHLHLLDIKGAWSAQNMALETQVDRLSRQVAAETTEKRKALHAQDELAERAKQVSFQLENALAEIEQRDQKIKLLSEEIDDISSTLRVLKDENDEEVTFLRNKVNKSTHEIDDLRQRLELSTDRMNTQTDESDRLIKSLNARIDAMQQELNDVRSMLEIEKQEKNAALLKNAEISQSEKRLQQELHNESHELSELYEANQCLEHSLRAKTNDVEKLNERIRQLEEHLMQQRQQNDGVDELRKEINDRNKTIKVLNQRLGDMKKTLQHELKSSSSNGAVTLVNGSNGSIVNGSESDKLVGDAVIMDDVNFKYLKHVILKFLTSREVEARHLIRAICTLLHLSHEEEQLLHDTLNIKVSWFGARSTDVALRNRHQKLFSIQSSSMSC